MQQVNRPKLPLMVIIVFRAVVEGLIADSRQTDFNFGMLKNATSNFLPNSP